MFLTGKKKTTAKQGLLLLLGNRVKCPCWTARWRPPSLLFVVPVSIGCLLNLSLSPLQYYTAVTDLSLLLTAVFLGHYLLNHTRSLPRI